MFKKIALSAAVAVVGADRHAGGRLGPERLRLFQPLRQWLSQSGPALRPPLRPALRPALCQPALPEPALRQSLRPRCSSSTGTIIGAIAGGLLGREIAGRGDRTVGAIIGAGAGALAGRAIDRNDCR